MGKRPTLAITCGLLLGILLLISVPALAQDQTSPVTTNAAVAGQSDTASSQAGDTGLLNAQLSAGEYPIIVGQALALVALEKAKGAPIDGANLEPSITRTSAVAMLPHVKANKLRAIAMTGARRSQALPDVPTVAETGLAGYEASSWYGVAAPAGTPRAIIERLNKEIVTVVKSKELQDRFNSEAVLPAGNTPEEFAAHIKREFERMGRVIRDAKIVLN